MQPAKLAVMRAIAFVCVLLPVEGCSAAKSDSSRDSDQKARTLLDAEEARQALIAMVEKSNDPCLRAGIARLKTDMARMTGNGRISIGKWDIDLARATFVLTLIKEPDFLHTYSGVFERSSDGKWKARITRERQT